MMCSYNIYTENICSSSLAFVLFGSDAGLSRSIALFLSVIGLIWWNRNARNSQSRVSSDCSFGGLLGRSPKTSMLRPSLASEFAN